MPVDVVLPCLDEAAALPWILGRMPAGFRPIVVDNGSTDGSAAIARRLGAHVIQAPIRGYGAACHVGMAAATSATVCVMDADATLDPSDLPTVVTPVQDGTADLVIGRRRSMVAGAFPLHARVGNAVLVSALHRRGIRGLHDIGPMRALRRSSVAALDIRDLRFGYPLELIVRAAAAGLTIIEREVSYRPRIGRSKVTGTLRGTARTIRDMRRVLTT